MRIRRGHASRRRVALTSVALGFVALMAGCTKQEYSNDRTSPENPLWFSRPNGAMQITFRRTLTASSRTVGEDYERGQAEIDAANGRVFVGASDRGLYALRAGNGSTIWRFETLGAVQSEPLYDPELDVVYFGSNDGALYCVRAMNGELVWRFNTGAEVTRRPARNGEILFVANGADNLFAIERRTGKQRWHVHRTSALGMEISGHAGPAYDDGKVYMAYSDGHVVAYDALDGSERWTPVDLGGEAEQSASGEAPRYLDVDTTPVVDETPSGKAVFVASYAGGVFALEAEKGALLWKNEQAIGGTDLIVWREPAHEPNPGGPFEGGPVVPARKLVIVSSATSGLWALDPATGREVWRVPVPEGGITAPVPVAGALLVGTTRYGLFLISPLNGRVIDGFDLGSGFAHTPAAYGLRAFALSNAGTLVGILVEPPLVGTARQREAWGLLTRP